MDANNRKEISKINSEVERSHELKILKLKLEMEEAEMENNQLSLKEELRVKQLELEKKELEFLIMKEELEATKLELEVSNRKIETIEAEKKELEQTQQSVNDIRSLELLRPYLEFLTKICEFIQNKTNFNFGINDTWIDKSDSILKEEVLIRSIISKFFEKLYKDFMNNCQMLYSKMNHEELFSNKTISERSFITHFKCKTHSLSYDAFCHSCKVILIVSSLKYFDRDLFAKSANFVVVEMKIIKLQMNLSQV